MSDDLRDVLAEAKAHAPMLAGLGQPMYANDVWTLLHAGQWLDALSAVLDLADEREVELGDLLLPDVRAMIRDIRAAVREALGVSDDHA